MHGKVNIYNVNNPGTPVDTIDTSLGPLQSRTIGTETFNTYPVITNGNAVAIYPHLGVLAYNQTYYVTVDPGIFTDTDGALYAGITTTNGWVFTTKPTGPANPNNVVVAADGSGDFCTVQGAVDSLPGGNTTYTLVTIRNGTYTEIVDTKFKNNITFRGQDRTGTVVGYPNNNSNNGGTGTRMAFKVYANDIAIENMTVTNMTPHGGSQAEALTVYTNAKRCILNNAVVSSFQDTILIDDASSQAYFYKSLIKGDTDYFWGIGNLFVTNCEIRTVNPSTSITQPRTTAGSNGFSFVNCLLTRSSAAVTNTTFARALGYCAGNAAFISCQIDSNLVGWTASDLANCPTIPWWEYNNTDLDTGNPVSYNGIILTNGDARLACASSATCWLNGWVPQLAPNILTNPVSVTVTSGVPTAFTVAATGIPGSVLSVALQRHQRAGGRDQRHAGPFQPDRRRCRGVFRDRVERCGQCHQRQRHIDRRGCAAHRRFQRQSHERHPAVDRDVHRQFDGHDHEPVLEFRGRRHDQHKCHQRGVHLHGRWYQRREPDGFRAAGNQYPHADRVHSGAQSSAIGGQSGELGLRGDSGRPDQ